jgi:hypothetical protein
MRKQISARRWRKSEPLDDQIPIEKPSLISKAVALLLESRAVTPAEIVTRINIASPVIETLSGLSPGSLAGAMEETPVVELK